MISGNGELRQGSGEMVAVLTRGGAVRLVAGPRRVSLSTPCIIDPRGVTLYRWPMRSVFIPLERVDRFDVVLREADPGDAGGIAYVELLVLLTRDGEKLLVSPPLAERLIGLRGLSLAARALQLNNHLPPYERTERG